MRNEGANQGQHLMSPASSVLASQMVENVLASSPSAPGTKFVSHHI